jgi:threonine dehydratase
VPLDLASIRAARERIAGRLHLTPTAGSTRLGDAAGVRLVLKCENLQKTGSFKVRGALHKVSQLDDAARARGVVTVSAGNHAQALAWAAREAGVAATVVMPANASTAKVDASRGYGAEVVLHGASSIDAFAKARELESERKLTFVHPFDDEVVCAGAGTVGLELLEQAPDLDVVVVPIGGGGLITGMLVALKESNPKLRVYGVEPEGAPSMRRSLDEGHAVRLDSVKTIADGLAAPMAGELNYEIVRRYADGVVLLGDDAIADAMRQLLLATKLLTEPAGAAATAAVLSGALPIRRGERVATVLSGGNIDLAKLATLLR